jgi:nicotinamide riboside kinase
MIKIAISGPHGCGKTTLINEMKDFFKSFNKAVYIIEEVARSYSYSSLETIESQRWIWENHIKEEIKTREANYDIILCDRCLLDNLIYYKYLLNQQEINIDPVFASFWNSTKIWMNTYDYISVLPMNPEFIVDDGFRIIDMNKTIEINKLFIKYLKPYQNIDINRFNYEEVIMEILND